LFFFFPFFFLLLFYAKPQGVWLRQGAPGSLFRYLPSKPFPLTPSLERPPSPRRHRDNFFWKGLNRPLFIAFPLGHTFCHPSFPSPAAAFLRQGGEDPPLHPFRLQFSVCSLGNAPRKSPGPPQLSYNLFQLAPFPIGPTREAPPDPRVFFPNLPTAPKLFRKAMWDARR